eukprot:TRINITY_DN14572_c0_g1_i2.p1 TRINITY_DN14572_c0_g1~~TRINITY_DN14572_c0_g1_i2.p1  ORF type:complete len:250 (-),score=18.35 TRINITY_DN14572_c0_g1_i2:239-988(-)
MMYKAQPKQQQAPTGSQRRLCSTKAPASNLGCASKAIQFTRNGMLKLGNSAGISAGSVAWRFSAGCAIFHTHRHKVHLDLEECSGSSRCCHTRRQPQLSARRGGLANEQHRPGCEVLPESIFHGIFREAGQAAARYLLNNVTCREVLPREILNGVDGEALRTRRHLDAGADFIIHTKANTTNPLAVPCAALNGSLPPELFHFLPKVRQIVLTFVGKEAFFLPAHLGRGQYAGLLAGGRLPHDRGCHRGG